MKKRIIFGIFLLLAAFVFADEFKPGNELICYTYTTGTSLQACYLYPVPYLPKYVDTKCICSKIAPAADGYVELVITITEPAGQYKYQGMKSTDISMYLKEDDEIEFNLQDINKQYLGGAYKAILKIKSAKPNLVEYELLKLY